MKQKILRPLLPAIVLLLAAFSACADQRDRAWEKTVAQDTPEAYREYIASHPDSQYLPIAQYHLERMVYRQAMAQNTISAYSDYLREFPQGHWATNARNSRSTLVAARIRRMPDDQLATVRVRFETEMGSFTVRVFPDRAPETSRNFLTLTANNFYDGLNIIRVEPKRLVQTGDPVGDGLGGPGYFLAYEETKIPHRRGAVVMWHSPVDLNTAGSQFFVLLEDRFQLQGQFAAFGEVVEGIEILDAISEVEATGPKGTPPFQPRKRISITRVVTEGLKIE